MVFQPPEASGILSLQNKKRNLNTRPRRSRCSQAQRLDSGLPHSLGTESSATVPCRSSTRAIRKCCKDYLRAERLQQSNKSHPTKSAPVKGSETDTHIPHTFSGHEESQMAFSSEYHAFSLVKAQRWCLEREGELWKVSGQDQFNLKSILNSCIAPKDKSEPQREILPVCTVSHNV